MKQHNSATELLFLHTDYGVHTGAVNGLESMHQVLYKSTLTLEMEEMVAMVKESCNKS